MRMLLTLALGLSAAVSSTEAQTVDQTIDQAIAAWNKVTTMRATFEQTIMNPITGSGMVARGSFQQKKPHLLSITFTEPKDDRIVADGKFVWVYLQSATPGQVLKMTMA